MQHFCCSGYQGEVCSSLLTLKGFPQNMERKQGYENKERLPKGVPSAYEEFVSIRNRFKNFAVILYI